MIRSDGVAAHDRPIRRMTCLATGLFALASLAGGAQEREGTRFVVLGHVYPIGHDVARVTELLRRVQAQEPDHVFVLGDSNLEQQATWDLIERELEAPVHCVPGNHELEADGARYDRIVGYRQKVVRAPDCSFVLIDSSDSAAHIAAFLEASLADLPPELPTILMTHHRVWDDGILSERPYEHDKSYLFAELQPALEGRVDYAFAGNSKHQYFSDVPAAGQRYDPDLGYWCDREGDMLCYSCGMGLGVPNATFVTVDVVGGRLVLTPELVTLAGDLPPRPPPPPWYRRIPAKVFRIARHRYFLLGVAAGTAGWCLLLGAGWYLRARRR